jgi:putative tricarboxylic transport membrane protein
MLSSDRLSGVGLVVLGALAYWGGHGLPPVPGQMIGPAVFPMVVGVGLVLCGSMIALGIGSSFEEEVKLDEAPEGAPPPLPDSKLKLALKTAVPPIMLMFYAAVVDRLGFVPTGMIMVFTTALALRSSLRNAVLVALFAPPVVHLVFLKLLRVPLPDGILPMPWV